MKMQGVHVNHAAIHRWVYKFAPSVEMQMKKCKLQVGGSWRMNETYIKIKSNGVIYIGQLIGPQYN